MAFMYKYTEKSYLHSTQMLPLWSNKQSNNRHSEAYTKKKHLHGIKQSSILIISFILTD